MYDKRIKRKIIIFISRNTVVVRVCYDINEVSVVTKDQFEPKGTVAIFGFSGEEREIINAALTNSPVELFDAEYATDLFAIDHLMLIVNVANVPFNELQQLLSYYTQVSTFSESVVLIGNCEQVGVTSRMTVYSEFSELENNLKYLLLSSQKKRKSNDSFSRSVSYALIILSMIKDNPGISSKDIADRLEISPRSVTRYIETLNMAGESIVYNRRQNGWSLEYSKSLLNL